MSHSFLESFTKEKIRFSKWYKIFCALLGNLSREPRKSEISISFALRIPGKFPQIDFSFELFRNSKKNFNDFSVLSHKTIGLRSDGIWAAFISFCDFFAIFSPFQLDYHGSESLCKWHLVIAHQLPKYSHNLIAQPISQHVFTAGSIFANFGSEFELILTVSKDNWQ